MNHGTGHDEYIITNNALIGGNIDIYQFCEYVQVTYTKIKSRVPFNIGGESVLKITIGMVFSITFAPKAYENIIIFPVDITDIS